MIDDNKIQAISNSIFERIKLGDPKTSSMEDVLVARFFQILTPNVLEFIQLVKIIGGNPSRITEVLHALADAIELVWMEDGGPK